MGGGVENPEDALVQRAGWVGARHAHVHEVRLTVGGHIEHGEAAAREARVHAHDAGRPRHAVHGGDRMVFAHAIARGGCSVHVCFPSTVRFPKFAGSSLGLRGAFAG